MTNGSHSTIYVYQYQFFLKQKWATSDGDAPAAGNTLATDNALIASIASVAKPSSKKPNQSAPNFFHLFPGILPRC